MLISGLCINTNLTNDRCGHEFCYGCGADAGSCSHGHAYYFSYEDLEPEVLGLMLVSIVAVIMIFFIR